MILVKKGEKLLDVIQKHKLSIDMSCGGNHKCGKCKIKTLEYIEPSIKEREMLTETVLNENIRLACMHETFKKDVHIEIVNKCEDFKILSDSSNLTCTKEQGYVAGIDIGTTTIVLCIYELITGKKVEEFKFLNPQKIYGADVISRIQACNELGVQVLHDILIEKINDCLSKSLYKIKRLCVCGNAAMTHIFMNEDPSSIGIAPYTCKVNEFRTYSSNHFFKLEHSFEVQVLPAISAFVGSDVLMGIYSLDLRENELLVDLGTNGEMVYYDGNQYIVTSSACGPAFEGGQMKCGTGAIAGAVDKVWYDTKFNYRTINDEAVIGVCGSGYISWIASLLEQGSLDESGYIEQDITLTEDIVLSKKDIREFQLSKSAVTSALDCLLNEKKVNKVYLSGGFSNNINIEACIKCGIFYNDWTNKIHVSGNTALKGICEFSSKQDRETIDKIKDMSKTISLMNDALFFERFIDNMYFKERE